jgi:hypothetical protein
VVQLSRAACIPADANSGWRKLVRFLHSQFAPAIRRGGNNIKNSRRLA